MACFRPWLGLGRWVAPYSWISCNDIGPKYLQ